MIGGGAAVVGDPDDIGQHLDLAGISGREGFDAQGCLEAIGDFGRAKEADVLDNLYEKYFGDSDS